ncbi:unnamed protein product [Camellia sinensis]
MPAKSLLRFWSVSKSWYSFNDDEYVELLQSPFHNSEKSLDIVGSYNGLVVLNGIFFMPIQFNSICFYGTHQFVLGTVELYVMLALTRGDPFVLLIFVMIDFIVHPLCL